MTAYEICRIAVGPLLPVLQAKVRTELKRLVRPCGGRRPKILDVGGRMSPYTVGLSADVTVLDKPRATDLQRWLNLGLTDELVAKIRRRRSNIRDVVFQDMTCCDLPASSFDGAVSVEVIEHVVEDQQFVQAIRRVLKPSGWVVLTTPNGDYIPNDNPDHVRHYTRAGLEDLLRTYFSEVNVSYAVRTGGYRRVGLKSISVSRPTRALRTMWCNLINHWQSRDLASEAKRTAHLIAVASGALR